jgi:hypothetical protein
MPPRGGGGFVRKQPTFAGFCILLAVALLGVSCRESASPERQSAGRPGLATAAASGIALDQVNGTLGENGTVLVKGFNPTNPHTGDAIIATFFWIGPPGIITAVTDYLTTVPNTPVGNTYTLVESSSANGISMATYVATNVQNFPDGLNDPSGHMILAVKATLAVPVPDGGLLISAWTGVDPVSPRAFGEHHSASGVGVGNTVADAGTIAVNAGALAYAATMSNGLVTFSSTPAGFTSLALMSDPFMKTDGEYDAEFTVTGTAGTVDPKWTWNFGLVPSTWLASVLALNPAPPPPGDLTVTTATTGPAPTQGYTVTVDGTNPLPIPATGSVTFTGVAAGGHSVALLGVPGNCTVSGANPQQVTVPSGGSVTVSFSVNCAGATGDRMTGGGKLGEGRDFATFGFEAMATGGHLTWVRHCGRSSQSPTCTTGSFTFHATITPGSYTAVSGQPNCRAWSGTGTAKFKDAPWRNGTYSFTVNAACDNGQPGCGKDYIDITIGDYHDSGYLSGGNIELHRAN